MGEQRILASDPGGADQFGFSVSISGNRIIVGAPNDVRPNGSGSAYVYLRTFDPMLGEWFWPEEKLIRHDGTQKLGYALSIDGDRAAVTAPGVFGDEKALVFERNMDGSNEWGLVADLQRLDEYGGNEFFGSAISVDVDQIVVGVKWDDAAGQYSDSGSAYLFAEDQGGPGNWGQVAKLIAPDAADYDLFGVSVSVAGVWAIAGAPHNQDQGPQTGSAYLFRTDQFCNPPGDLDDDGDVDAADLAILLGSWGPCPDPNDCPADLDGDGSVNAFDLAFLLGNWGP